MNKGEQTRKHILEAAAPVFNQHGFEGTTLSQLMQATGLEKGGIYRHFSSKEDLAAESFKYAWNKVLRLRLAGLDEIPTALGKLRHLIDNFIGIRSPIAGGCPLLNTAMDCDDGNTILRDLARKTLHGWQRRLSRIVEEGIRSGEIKPETSAKATANILISVLEGTLLITRLERDYGALEDARALLGLHLKAIAQTRRKRC